MQAIETISEVEAYQKIEADFGFYPVALDYLPDGMEFTSVITADDAQNVYLCYEGQNDDVIIYFMYSNYRTSSLGKDVEDALSDEYTEVILNHVIEVKKYSNEDLQGYRYMISFEHQNVYYLLEINNVADAEVKKIVENLYFVDK